MSESDPGYEYVSYEPIDDGRIVRILLDRPEARNAQNRGMLVELNDAFLRAERDDEVRVVILGGAGKMFTSGHDLGSKVAMDEIAEHPSWQENGGTRKGAERLVIELRDKVSALGADAPTSAQAAPTASGWRDQVAAGLESLGWSAKDAAAAVERVAPLADEEPTPGVGDLMKAALRSLARN